MLKTEFENSIANGIDETNRRIFFGRYLSTADAEIGNGFDNISVEYAVRSLIKMASDNNKKPIEIYMNSYGGDPYSMMYLYDAIQSCPCQVKFFGGGAIMSAATWIMAGCDERYLYPGTTIMIHNGSYSIDDRFTDGEIRLAEEKRLQDFLEHIYEKNSRMSKEFWQDVCKRDLYLTADEAITLGLADKIVEPKKRGTLRKVRQAHLNQKVSKTTFKKLLTNINSRIHNKTEIKDIIIKTEHKEEIDDTLIVEDAGGNNEHREPGPIIPTDVKRAEPVGNSDGDKPST
jgi:ATP-dependent Clp protease protease subunit